MNNIRNWIDAKHPVINILISYLDLSLSVGIELVPNGNYLCTCKFYENELITQPRKVRNDDYKKLAKDYSYKIEKVLSEMDKTNPKHSILSFISMSRRTLLSQLGNFWTLNIISLIYRNESFVINSILLPHGAILNILSSYSLPEEILLQVHSSNTRLIQKLRHKRLEYRIRVLKKSIIILRYIILLLGLIPFSTMFSLDYFLGKNIFGINSFVILGIMLVILIVVPKIIEKNFEKKTINYLNSI